MRGPYHNPEWNKYVIMPKCCEKASRGAVWLRHRWYFYDSEDYERVWTVAVFYDDSRPCLEKGEIEHAEASFCPFCGTALPEVEKVDPPGPVCVVTDGGYYCDTCKERLDSCECLPPDACWRLAQ